MLRGELKSSLIEILSRLWHLKVYKSAKDYTGKHLSAVYFKESAEIHFFPLRFYVFAFLEKHKTAQAIMDDQ